MQNKFEEHIKQALKRSDEFHDEPLPGHEERFEMRLLKQGEQRKLRRLPRWSLIITTAAAVVVFIVAIVISEVKKTNDMAEKARLSDVSPELAAVEDFYNEKLHIDVEQLNKGDQNIKRFLSDISKLESEYKRLEENLSKNFNNERIAQAMVNNYKYRLQLMEQLQKYIEIQNKINTQNNEQKLSS
jgi:uncharacterized protein YhaN